MEFGRGVSVPRHQEMLDIFSPNSLASRLSTETSFCSCFSCFFFLNEVGISKEKQKNYFSKGLRTNNPVNSSNKVLPESATVGMTFTLN